MPQDQPATEQQDPPGANTSRPSTSSSNFGTTPRSFPASNTSKHQTTAKKLFNAVLLIPKALFSISFIVLVLAICAAVVPSILVWTQAVSDGMGQLQDRVLLESVKQTALTIKTRLQLKLSMCEYQVKGYTSLLNSIVQEQSEDADLGLDFWLNNTKDMGTLLITYGGCAGTLVMLLQDGGFGIILQTMWGHMFGVQRGYPPANTSVTLYFYDVTLFEVAWQMPIPVSLVAFEYMAGFDDSLLQSLLDNPNIPVWSPFAVKGGASKSLTADILGGIVDYNGDALLGMFSSSLSPENIQDLFADNSTEGILCTFVQDIEGCFISSSCELAQGYNDSRVLRACSWNSSLAYVRESYQFLDQALASNLTTQVAMFKQDMYAFGFTEVKTDYGFTAIVTVVADVASFTQTYDSAKSNTLNYVIVSIVIAAFLAGIISLFTFLGQFQVIQRIKRISDISMGTSTAQYRLKSSSVHPERETENFHKERICGLHSFNIFGHLSEIAVILRKLEWLEGKVQIVTAFIPVIAKLVCRQDISDSKILDSKLSRRLGCYMFVDIEDFTPLCEATAPDTAASVLEVFYNFIEKAAQVSQHDLLVKRLGDGLLITWGFKLEVEESESTRQLPILAYAAALRIGEEVIQINQKCREIVGFQLPNWNMKIRIGISTGPALHGLLKTDCMTSPDVVGAMVNLAARCQTVGKLPDIKALGQTEVEQDTEDRILCTVVSDVATFDANTVMADTTTTHASMQKMVDLAQESIISYPRRIVEGVTLQGIGQTSVGITFITRNRAVKRHPTNDVMLLKNCECPV